MLREIRLYGRLAKFIGHRVLHADVASAAEAVKFLLANWPDVERHMADQRYRVCIGDDALELDELGHPIGQQPIKIIPVVAGAITWGEFWGGVGKVLTGVAIVAAAIFAAPLLAPILGAGLAGAIGSIGIGVGASLVLGGISNMLTPVSSMAPTNPSYGDDSDPRKSYGFSGIQNTSRQGVPCPIVFGEALVGSVVISAGIDVVQVTA